MSDNEKMPETDLPENENEQREKEQGIQDSELNIPAEENTTEPAEEVVPEAAEQPDYAEATDSGKEEIKEEDSPSDDEIIDEPEDLPEPRTKKDAQSELDDAVAEHSEDETAHEKHGIEKKDYHAMSKEDL